ncbi:MAG: RNA polymerase factor sigma-32 [Polyangiaceae bacterium]|nr:RNA polymerase factor sigma-32 [Polyangiaceae bacterium]
MRRTFGDRRVPRKKSDQTSPAGTPKPRTRKSTTTAGAPKAGGRGARAAAPSNTRASSNEEQDDEEAGPASEAPPSSRRGESEDVDESDVVETVGEVIAEDEPGPKSSAPSSAPASIEPAALSRTDPLQAYLREIQRYPLLTLEEEQKLTRSYVDSQDVQTAARLVTANLRLVVKLAYEYRRAYKNIMDLIQEGNIGLMQAVKRYDPYRGVKLSSYAAWWIRAYILRFILNNWRLVKLGTTQAQRKLFFNLNKEKAKLAAMGIDATSERIAERLGVDEKEVIEMDRRLSSAEASLDAPVGDAEGRSVSRVDLMPSAVSGPDNLLERHEMDALVAARLREFRTTLKGKDVVIFDKRMAAEEPLTLQELGDEFGISRERVRQLEARLHHKLRDYLKQELGDAVGSSR